MGLTAHHTERHEQLVPDGRHGGDDGMVRSLASFDVVWVTFDQGEPAPSILEGESTTLGDGAGAES